MGRRQDQQFRQTTCIDNGLRGDAATGKSRAIHSTANA